MYRKLRPDRYHLPTVCNREIKNIEEIVITTEDNNKYTLLLDSSYRSCVRYITMVLPKLTKFSYEKL